MIPLIDTHAHLTGEELFGDAATLIEAAQACGVRHIFNIATDSITLERGLLLNVTYPSVKNIAACTPHDVERFGDSFFIEVQRALEQGKLLAIGETGLDYYYLHSPKEVQIRHLHQYAQLANHYRLPLVIHCRAAFDDLMKVLDQYPKLPSVIIHCFTGTSDEAKACMERGYTLSFSGIITFKKSTELQKICQEIPSDRLVIETDAPYLAPSHLRGKRNEPAFILETFQKVAALRGWTRDQAADILYQNSLKAFHFEKKSL